jgi:hypothetical protein
MADGTTCCTIEPQPHIWDLGGTMTATFSDPGDPDEQIGYLDADQELLVTVTVKLTGRIRYYLCDTTLCVCVAFNACGPGSSGDFCEKIVLEGDNCPCNTDTWVFKICIPAGTFTPGECGREYELCITLGSRDCCDKVGFIFGSCHEYHLTVTPAVTDAGPDT